MRHRNAFEFAREPLDAGIEFRQSPHTRANVLRELQELVLT